MSAETETNEVPLSLGQTVLGLIRHYAGGRGIVVILAVAAVAAGLYLSWGWLAAIGVAPLLVTLAPCAAMCALGLCMNRAGGKSCSTDQKPNANEATAGAKTPSDRN